MRASKFLSIIVFFGLLLSLAFGCKKDPPKVIPIISTASITDITSSTAISGGIIKSDGNSPITSKGICWSTNPNPTIIDNKTSDGSGITNFTSSITQLSPGVTYYVRAYATNSIGTGYGNEISFISSAIIPSVITSAITDITPETAIGGGGITNDGGSAIIAHGVCWSTQQTPTITESKTISDTLGITYISNIIDLEQGTTYYVRAYATSNVGTGYGNVVSFTSTIRSVDSDFKPLGLIFETLEELLAIPTDEFYTPMGPITKSSELNTQLGVPHPGKQRGNACVGWALGYGMMSYFFNSVEGYNDYNADYKVFSPYFIWNQQREKIGSINIDTAISISDALELVQDQGCCKVSDMNMPNDMSYLTILPSAKAKVNAANYIITSYQRCFTFDLEKFKSYISKDKVPLVIGLDVDAAFQKHGTKQFETIDGRLVWTKYDNKWFKKNPKSGHAVLICGFDDNINAFKVLNSWGTDWGQDGYFWLDYNFARTAIRSNNDNYHIFVAHVKRPLIQTKSVTNITNSTAKSGGTEIKDWGIYTIEKGICWSTDPKPTISHNKIKYGAGLGDFICSITGLSPQTTYYVSAYAINAQGISYGVPEKFTTLSIQTPTVKTMAVTTYSASSATVGGTVTEDGGATITEHGVYWGTNPLINGIKLQIGNGMGSFSTSLTELNPSTTYYIRAYAINSKGTAYGTQVSFTTGQNFSLATVTTAATNITASGATLGGDVTSDGNAAVTEKGVYYSTSPDPKLTGTKVSSGKDGTGTFTVNVSDLSPDKIYYVQAYAINSQGIAYGNTLSIKTIELKVGDSYGGGIVAYILGKYDFGYDANMQHGLIAATGDQSTGIKWYNASYTITGATGNNIGHGFINTNIIISSQGGTSTNYAAGIARAYKGGGFNDWFLPSSDELMILLKRTRLIGGFIGSYYWSSTELHNSSTQATGIWQGGIPSKTSSRKDRTASVRAVRYF